MRVAMQKSPFNRGDLFEEQGFEVVQGVCRSEDDLADLLGDADGALVGVMPLTSRSVLERCPKLKVVSRLGVGVDSIDLDAATELGILATNVPGSNTTEVADHATAQRQHDIATLRPLLGEPAVELGCHALRLRRLAGRYEV